MNHTDKAQEYFSNNFNCSQAVFTTFATEMGLDEELALKIATQFGGGARKGEMCGAVSGALMVLGLKYGHCHSENEEEKGRAYRISEDFMNRFIQKNGTVVCRELLGYDLSEPEDMKKIVTFPSAKRFLCPQVTFSEILRLSSCAREDIIVMRSSPLLSNV